MSCSKRRRPSAAAPNIVRTRSAALLPLSAKSPEALRALATRYRRSARIGTGQQSFTTCAGPPRRGGRPWSIARCSSPRSHRDGRQLAALCRGRSCCRAEASYIAMSKPRIGFVCPGQGAQWVGMARQLMARAGVSLPRWSAAIWRPGRTWTGPSSSSFPPSQAPPAYRLDQIDVIQPVLVAMAIAYADSVAFARRRARCGRRSQHGRSRGRVHRRCARP